LLSLAAVVSIALGTIGVGLYAGQPDAGPYAGPALGPWQSTQGSNAAHMRAIVRYRPMGWGTQVAVQVSGIPLNTPCAIESYERNGTTTVGGSWVTDIGEGKVWYTASTAVSRDSVTKFVITVAGHPATVITLPIWPNAPKTLVTVGEFRSGLCRARAKPSASPRPPVRKASPAIFPAIPVS
jgi:hypothetical protein